MRDIIWDDAAQNSVSVMSHTTELSDLVANHPCSSDWQPLVMENGGICLRGSE